MKHITIKAINAALPRLDTMKRHYMPENTTGWIDGREFIGSAFADVDKDSGEIAITIYASGDAMEEKHYHSERYNDTVIDITEQIENAISGATRSETVHAIYNIVNA